MLTTWRYYQRWGRDGRGEPVRIVLVHRQSNQGHLETAVDGIWTPVPGQLADDDIMLDEIAELDGLALAHSLTSPPA